MSFDNSDFQEYEQLHVVCAWCKIVIREGRQDIPASHGICPACAVKVKAEHELLSAKSRLNNDLLNGKIQINREV